MKRIALVVIILLLVTTYCFAQRAREPAYTDNVLPGVTYYSNIGATGLDVTNNPGYILMRGVGIDAKAGAGVADDSNTYWFLWIDEESDLCMASYTTINAYSSFPSGTWDDDTKPPVCTKVGGQS